MDNLNKNNTAVKIIIGMILVFLSFAFILDSSIVILELTKNQNTIDKITKFVKIFYH